MNATRMWLVFFCAIPFCAMTVGCRGNLETDVLERELRHHEDRIYDLEDCLDQYHALLESCRRENRALKTELGMPGGANDDFDGDDGEPLLPPRIDFGDGSDVNVGDRRSPTDPLAIMPASASAELSPVLATHDGRLDRIEFNPLLSGALDADGMPGDEGVLAVIEPRGADGELLRVRGQVSLMICDASKSGRRSQLVRWNFDRDELDAYWRKSPLAEGYVFELPWPAEVPRGRELQLWARLVTDSGQKYLTRRNIRVEPGGATQPPIGQFQRVKGWTERTARAPRDLMPVVGPVASLPIGSPPNHLSPPSAPPKLKPLPRELHDDADPVEIVEEPRESEAKETDESAQVTPAKDNPLPRKPVKRPEWSPDR